MAKADIPVFKEPLGRLKLMGWCHTAALGRHDERHTEPVLRARDVPDKRRGSRGGSRQENKQVFVADPVILVCASRGSKMGAINKDGMDFLNDLGMRITQSIDDHCESAFLFQQLSVLIQRYDAVAVSVPSPTRPRR